MRRHLMVSRMCFSPRSDFQSFFKVFTQISPRDDTLGWKIFVRKKPVKYDEVRYVMHTYSRRYICRNAGNCHNTGAFSQKLISITRVISLISITEEGFSNHPITVTRGICIARGTISITRGIAVSVGIRITQGML